MNMFRINLQYRRTMQWISVALLLVASLPVWSKLPVDPLDSPMWTEMHQRLMQGQRYQFDDRVRVIAPGNAENSLNVPVKVDARAIEGVQRMVVFADLNPIPKILEFMPGKALPTISFNFKVQQATPLRAAVLDSQGLWHVGGIYLEASGGGCTQPSVGSASSNWSDHLGELQARLWKNPAGQRLRLRIMHPMDTGLADHIPAFYIEDLQVSDERGDTVTRLRLFEPVSENPTLTLDLNKQQALNIFAVDNNGNQVRATVQQDF